MDTGIVIGVVAFVVGYLIGCASTEKRIQRVIEPLAARLPGTFRVLELLHFLKAESEAINEKKRLEQSITNDYWIERARQAYEGIVLFNNDARVIMATKKDGAYVEAWAWVEEREWTDENVTEVQSE